MNLAKKWLQPILVFLWLMANVLPPTLNAQEIRSIQVMDGVKAFYMADFQGARNILQDALLYSRLGDEDLFAAHVYIAFSYLREEIEAETARLYIIKAIQIAPDVQLDVGKIPPDLYQQFIQIRQSVIGSLSIHTTPEDASAVLIEPTKNRAQNLQTPGVFENLLEGRYNLLVSRPGSQSYSAVVTLAAGEAKSIEVVLLEKRRSFLQKYWPYGAGALAATAIVVAVGGKGETRPGAGDLPTPPVRPTRP
jgi:hypothetical protein